jgi:hypothetical protein
VSEYLRRDIPRRPTFERNLLNVIASACEAKVSDANFKTFLVDDEDVIWLDVPVDDVLSVH